MKLNALALFVILLVSFFAIIALFLSNDKVSCSVSNAGYEVVNGYYVAFGGLYIHLGQNSLLYYPDIFEILKIRNDFNNPSSITFADGGKWKINAFLEIGSTTSYENIYVNNQRRTAYVDNPPPTDWETVPKFSTPISTKVKAESHYKLLSLSQIKKNSLTLPFNSLDSIKTSQPLVHECVGSLQDSPDVPSYMSGNESNVQKLWNRPVVTLILALLTYIFYLLYTNKIDGSLVTMSYDLIINRKEYYRIVSSSLSHFDLMHYGFNSLALYQFGDLELEFGSLPYLYQSINLIFITIAICLLIQHIMITRFNRVDVIHQQAIGYSCVLFAWMVVAAVRMKKFCPIFLFPQFCLTTYFIKIPFWTSFPGLPVNLGPLVLLIITKVIIPRSSFLGHLSGILIGYPLAWNLLDWLTPPMLLSILIISALYILNLNVWTFPNFNNPTVNLHDFVPASQLLVWNMLKVSMWILGLVTILPMFYFFGSWQSIVFRSLLVYITWSSINARKCEWLTDNRSVHADCGHILLLTSLLSVFLAFYDIMSLGGILGSKVMLSTTLKSYSTSSFTWVSVLVTLVAIIEICISGLVLSCLHNMNHMSAWLLYLKLDKASVATDIEFLTCRPFFKYISKYFQCRFARTATATPGNDNIPSTSPIPPASTSSAISTSNSFMESGKVTASLGLSSSGISLPSALSGDRHNYQALSNVDEDLSQSAHGISATSDLSKKEIKDDAGVKSIQI